MKRYVILTGSKNNAGDFLIKKRGIELLNHFKKDYEIVEYNRWEYLTDEKLEVVNNSTALILLGGPGLVYNMYPGIFKLRNNLNDIKVPIITMGIGWKAPVGNFEDIYNYKLSQETLKLLERIDSNPFPSSVRGYDTLRVLQKCGFKNFVMTGCPAYYNLDYINNDFKFPNKEYNKLNTAFSVGVTLATSNSMYELNKNIIDMLSEQFLNFTVVFHHSIDRTTIQKVYGKNNNLLIEKYLKLIDYLEKKNINYIDISGDAESLENFYRNVDLHIGFRVHAHIYMNSIKKFSILLSEDGRANEVYRTIGGIVLPGFLKYKNSLLFKILNKIIKSDRYIANNFLVENIKDEINYEFEINYKRLEQSFYGVKQNFEIMKIFLGNIP